MMTMRECLLSYLTGEGISENVASEIISSMSTRTNWNRNVTVDSPINNYPNDRFDELVNEVLERARLREEKEQEKKTI